MTLTPVKRSDSVLDCIELVSSSQGEKFERVIGDAAR